MKPHSVEDWKLALDAIEWFQQQLRAKSPEEVRAWISPSPPQDDIVAGLIDIKTGAEVRGDTSTMLVIDHAIAALGENGWQPIETVARNGTPVLLFAGSQQWVASWDTHTEEWWVAEEATLRNPTHWMPLPSPPLGAS